MITSIFLALIGISPTAAVAASPDAKSDMVVQVVMGDRTQNYFVSSAARTLRLDSSFEPAREVSLTADDVKFLLSQAKALTVRGDLPTECARTFATVTLAGRRGLARTCLAFKRADRGVVNLIDLLRTSLLR